MVDQIGLFEAIYNMRAMRRLKPDPVPDELIRKIIDAGLRAPTGGDAQNWRFIVGFLAYRTEKVQSSKLRSGKTDFLMLQKPRTLGSVAPEL
jgi:nitroreductase